MENEPLVRFFKEQYDSTLGCSRDSRDAETRCISATRSLKFNGKLAFAAFHDFAGASENSLGPYVTYL